jgi:nicotinamide-nucleotide amidase
MVVSRVEYIAVGDELLDGRIVDTNAGDLARALAPQVLARTQAVGDDVPDIAACVREAVARGSTALYVSGGLGPTSDDVTRSAISAVAGVAMRRDPAVAAALRQRFSERGAPFTDNQLQQADLPAGAHWIDNPVGTAPGFCLALGDCQCTVLPGVPAEFRAMLPAQGASDRTTVVFYGIGEGKLASEIDPLAAGRTIRYRTCFPEVEVQFTDAALASAICTRLARHVISREGESLPQVAAQRLRDCGATLALAESCTGGLVAHLVTSIPGVSDVFLGGAVAYGSVAKQTLLDVTTLEQFGAVSAETARAMAEGARARLGATYGLAITGIAGPGGGSAQKPVGTTWVGLATPAGAQSRTFQWRYDDRARNIRASAFAALYWLWQEAG